LELSIEIRWKYEFRKCSGETHCNAKPDEIFEKIKNKYPCFSSQSFDWNGIMVDRPLHQTGTIK